MTSMFSDAERKVFSVLVNKPNKDIIEALSKELNVPIETGYRLFKLGWSAMIAKLLYEAEATYWKNLIKDHQKFLVVIQSMINSIKENENAEIFRTYKERSPLKREILETE